MALIDEMRRQEALKQRRPNSFGDAAAVAQDSGVTQAGRPGVSLGAMHSAGGRSGGQMIADGLTSGARSFFDSFQKSPEPAPAPAVVRGMPGNQTDVQRGGGNVPAIGDVASPAPAVTSPQAPAAAPGSGDVTRVGNSYSGTNVSGDISINGQAPRNGGQISARNMAAADNLAGRQGLAAFAAAPAAGAGVPLIQAAGIRHSGNDWQARIDLRNAEVSAGSIMNRAEWSRSGKPDAEGKIAAFNAAKAADAALRGQQPAADTAAMQANAGLMREGVQQQGANSRSLVQAMLEQQKVNQAGEAQGYTNRANRLVEAMRNQVAAEPDQNKRKWLVQHMMDLEGKSQQADPYLVVPGGQHIDPQSGKAYNTPASVFNRQTQQWIQQPGQGGGTPSTAAVAALRADPKRAAEFDAKFGAGAARAALGS